MTLPSLARSFVAATLLLAGCSSTSLKESWVDPSVHSVAGFKKVFVAYLGANPSVQRSAEDALAAHLHAPEVRRCYEVFPDAPGMDPKRVREQLVERGFDAAIVMRVSGVEQEVSWSPSAYPASYRSFGGYWGDPGTLRTDEIVHVETNLYSLADDKLLYAARSETFNPSSMAKQVDEIVAAIADDLDDKGILRPAAAKP